MCKSTDKGLNYKGNLATENAWECLIRNLTFATIPGAGGSRNDLICD